jgi:hypothetical protein
MTYMIKRDLAIYLPRLLFPEAHQFKTIFPQVRAIGASSSRFKAPIDGGYDIGILKRQGRSGKTGTPLALLLLDGLRLSGADSLFSRLNRAALPE